jgi:hypothetical protein
MFNLKTKTTFDNFFDGSKQKLRKLLDADKFCMGELLTYIKNIFVMYAKKERQILLEVCNFAKRELL